MAALRTDNSSTALGTVARDGDGSFEDGSIRGLAHNESLQEL